MTKRRRKTLIGLGVAFTFLLADYALFPSFASPTGPSRSSGDNALWLRYTWYFGEKPDGLTELAYRAEHYGIRDLYFHVRGIQVDGSLKYRYLESARTLNRNLKVLAPSRRRFAWIYAGNPQGRGEVDLSKPAVRHRMVGEAKWLVEQAGFDGVQWDYEICPDGDKNLLALLEETRAALSPSVPISVAVPAWLPAPFSGFGWSPEYYKQVALRSDQMAVMVYDTGAYSPRIYTWLVGKQFEVVAPAVDKANPRCQLVMGLPTYSDGTLSHNPHAESLRLGLIGVRDGLISHSVPRPSVGLFADYTTDADEWKTFEELWPTTIFR